MNRNLTRRKLLAGLGGAGVVSVAGLSLATRDALAISDTMEIGDGTEITLLAEWREAYNGTVLEDSTMEGTEDGGRIALQDVKPGDNGVFSLELTSAEENETSINPAFTISLTETAENGLTEPEREAGDDSAGDGEGELQEFLQAELWYDDGIADVDIFGANNGEQDFGERSIAAGTLVEVADAIDSEPLRCLDPGESVTISFGWSFPSGDRDVNRTQGDGVEFDFKIAVDSC